MGKFADNLLKRIALRRLVKKQIKWPRDFKGMVMWCPMCSGEIARVAEGEQLDGAQQQDAVNAHDQVCPRRNIRLVP